MSEIQSKYPLIRKEQTIKTEWTLEGKEVRKQTSGRLVRPAKKLDAKEEIDAYIEQMGTARLHYSNIMELPYCVEYAVGIGHPLYDYAVEKQDALPAKSDKTPPKKIAIDADLIIQGELGELPNEPGR